MADGLPESACVSVALAPQGKVLARHLKSGSVSELDGYTVNVIPSPGPGNGRVYQSPGGQLWAVVADGLQEFKNGHWVLHPVPGNRRRVPRPAPARWSIPSRCARPGRALSSSSCPTACCNSMPKTRTIPARRCCSLPRRRGSSKFSSMTLARDGGLWIAGARGLVKSAGAGSQSEARQPSGANTFRPNRSQIQNLQEPHEDEAGVVTTLAESATHHHKVLVHFDGQHWTAEAVPVERARHAWCSVDKTCWAATIDSLFRMGSGRAARRSRAKKAPGANTTTWRSSPAAPSGWRPPMGCFATPRSPGEAPPPVRKLNSLVHCLAGDEAGRLWFVSGSGLHLVQNDRHQEFPLPATGVINAAGCPRPVPLEEWHALLLGGGRAVASQFQPDSGAFSPVPA